MYRLNSVVRGATLVLMLVPTALYSQGKARNTPARTASSGSGSSVSVTVVFRDPDRTVFRDYFRTQGLVVTPLPPGIAKNVARGKPLPPGIAKKMFPRRLIARPGVGIDIVFVMVGHDMLAVRNGVVVDMMVNVFP